MFLVQTINRVNAQTSASFTEIVVFLELLKILIYVISGLLVGLIVSKEEIITCSRIDNSLQNVSNCNECCTATFFRKILPQRNSFSRISLICNGLSIWVIVL